MAQDQPENMGVVKEVLWKLLTEETVMVYQGTFLVDFQDEFNVNEEGLAAFVSIFDLRTLYRWLTKVCPTFTRRRLMAVLTNWEDASLTQGYELMITASSIRGLQPMRKKHDWINTTINWKP